MKSLIKWTVTLMIVTMIIGILPTEAEGEIYEYTLRLHILANSDSNEDQALKIKLRDKILTKYGNLLSRRESISEAIEKITERLPEIKADAGRWIAEMGYDYKVDALIGEEWYERREYEDFSLPAGYYVSLRIIIGEGEGQNWWCVMYPPLCMEIATEAAPPDDGVINYTKEELLLISSSGYQVKFKILEELSRVFAKNS